MDDENPNIDQLNFQGQVIVARYKIVKLRKPEHYVLIQTDKGQYKAKDSVKFRALALDDRLKPSPVDSVDKLWIEDPRGRRVQQWLDVDAREGLLQREMRLGGEPLLGTWTIHYEASPRFFAKGVKMIKEKATFQVSEYVLPKFEVEIRSPPSILRNAERVEWLVCGKYTHGGRVKGSVKANFSSEYGFWMDDGPMPRSHGRPWQQPTKFFVVENEVTGGQECAAIVLQGIEMLYIIQDSSTTIKLEVAFEEEGTGKVEKAETFANVENQEILLESRMERSWPYIGIPYIGQLLVKNHDGSPVKKEVIKLCVKFDGLGWGACRYLLSDEEGSIKFHVPLPTLVQAPDRRLKITAKAVNRPSDPLKGMRQPERTEFVSFHNNERKRNEMDLMILGQEHKQRLPCERWYKAKVFFASPVQKTVVLHYDIISKGEIVISDQMEVQVGYKLVKNVDAESKKILKIQNQVLDDLVRGTEKFSFGGGIEESWKVTSAEIPIFVDHRLSPSLKLIVYVVQGITVVDSQIYQVESCQEHKVSVDWEKEKVSPGSNVSLSVDTGTLSHPLTRCALSVTDKSVNLLGNRNSITEERLEDLKQQISLRKDQPSPRSRCPLLRDALKPFEGTGLTIVCEIPGFCECERVIRDENRNQKKQFDFDYSDYDMRVVAFEGVGARPPQASEEMILQGQGATRTPGGTKIEAPKLSLRSFFPETWLFTLTRPGYTRPGQIDSVIEQKLTAPASITTWQADAFCVGLVRKLDLMD